MTRTHSYSHAYAYAYAHTHFTFSLVIYRKQNRLPSKTTTTTKNTQTYKILYTINEDLFRLYDPVSTFYNSTVEWVGQRHWKIDCMHWIMTVVEIVHCFICIKSQSHFFTMLYCSLLLLLLLRFFTREHNNPTLWVILCRTENNNNNNKHIEHE